METAMYRSKTLEVPVFGPPPGGVTIKTFEYKDGDDKILDEIYGQIRQAQIDGFEPKFIVLGADKYRQLTMTSWVWLGSTFPSEFSGIPIVVIPDEGVVRVSTDPKHELIYRSERVCGRDVRKLVQKARSLIEILHLWSKDEEMLAYFPYTAEALEEVLKEWEDV